MLKENEKHTKELFEVRITYSEFGHEITKLYRKDVEDLYELKQSFLKRFGNIDEAPNKTMKEKGLVKRLTRNAENINEWVNSVNNQTRWKLEVFQIHKKKGHKQKTLGTGRTFVEGRTLVYPTKREAPSMNDSEWWG